jgi:dTDP-glucose 4,6-dehydratase
MADALSGARLLVTGGAGFIGSNFARMAIARWPGARVHVLDALTYAGNQRNLEDVADAARLSFQHGDIRDPKAVAQAMGRPVVNSAESMVDRSSTTRARSC